MPVMSLRNCLKRLLFFIAFVGLASCATTPPTNSDKPAESLSDSNDVVLLPTEDFPYEVAVQLAKALARDTGLRIRAMLNMGTRDWVPFTGASQYDPMKLKDIAMPAIGQLKKDYGGTLYILLTTRDLNSSAGGLRFVFAENYPQEKVTVISVARMRYGSQGREAAMQLVLDRLRKMTLRTIGLQYYELPRSANPTDLMFSPLMSLDALDAMQPVLKR